MEVVMERRLGLAAALALSLWLPGASAQAPQNSREAHCAAARAAAGTEHLSLFNRFTDICGNAAGVPQRGRGAAAAGVRQIPARDTWYHPPAKVFDNLYFIGTKVHNAWALQTSEGLIVIDALYDYATKDEMVDGLRTLGLNPAAIKYLVISHGHGDHHGGAKLLQDEFGPRLVMGGPDWELVAANKRDPAPRRDIVASDGQKVTLGDTTVTLYSTPGHTAGTFSVVVPVKDNGRPHLIATWGGTALTRSTPPDALKQYVESAVRYRELLARLGVEGMISNHSEFDSSTTKIQALAARKPGARHPFLTGADSVKRYMTVVEEVARAALAASTGG
jgi:metallo-beta-lactamase class B